MRILKERLGQFQQQDASPTSCVDEQTSLAAEKSSRQDLELYTSILNAKNASLTSQLSSCRGEMDKWKKVRGIRCCLILVQRVAVYLYSKSSICTLYTEDWQASPVKD